MARVQEQFREFMKVDISDVSADILNKIKKKIDLGWKSYPDIFIRAPTMLEYSLFREYMKSNDGRIISSTVGIEATAISRGEPVKWNGTVCSVGESHWDFYPVPHVETKKLSPTDQIIATTACMMLKMDKEKNLVPAVATSTLSDGPLSSLMSPVALASYTNQMSKELTKFSVKEHKDEGFCREVYESVASVSQRERHRLRKITYDLYDKVAISANSTGDVMYSKDFVLETKEVNSYLHSGKKVYVPAVEFKSITKSINLVPEKMKKQHDLCNALMSQITSRFPSRLTKFAGYRGFPDKNQRLYMDIAPYLAQFVALDPSEMIKRWIEANHDGRVRRSGSDVVESTLKSTEQALVFTDFSDDMVLKKPALCYGNVTFTAEFWDKYKVLMYSVPSKSSFFYCPQDMELSIPKEHCGRTLMVATSSLELSKLLQKHIGVLTSMVFKGTWLSKGARYKDLKYPLIAKKYESVVVEEWDDEERTAHTGEVKSLYNLVTSKVVEDSDQDEVEDVVMVPPPMAYPKMVTQSDKSNLESIDVDDGDPTPASLLGRVPMYWLPPATKWEDPDDNGHQQLLYKDVLYVGIGLSLDERILVAKWADREVVRPSTVDVNAPDLSDDDA
jgi:hypothetical protein